MFVETSDDSQHSTRFILESRSCTTINGSVFYHFYAETLSLIDEDMKTSFIKLELCLNI